MSFIPTFFKLCEYAIDNLFNVDKLLILYFLCYSLTLVSFLLLCRGLIVHIPISSCILFHAYASQRTLLPPIFHHTRIATMQREKYSFKNWLQFLKTFPLDLSVTLPRDLGQGDLKGYGHFVKTPRLGLKFESIWFARQVCFKITHFCDNLSDLQKILATFQTLTEFGTVPRSASPYS